MHTSVNLMYKVTRIIGRKSIDRFDHIGKDNEVLSFWLTSFIIFII